ncbi:hypothetical protein L218DRAFT_1050362 [Marasmius fiardii PR-910]|nr:hypothetical protein L218DRAFT_1050362 [Marasmius fiardii PR-910]
MISGRDAPPPPETAGYHIVGYFLNWGLFGTLCVQVFLYYLAFPKDKLSMKLVVYVLLALDIVQTVLITRDAFFKFGTHFADTSIFPHLENLWLSVFIINAINGAIVQMFFAYRIASLSKSRVLGIAVAILALAGGAAGIASGIRGKLSKFNTLATNALNTRVEVWLSISAACDVLIATSMVTILSRRRKSGLNPVTDDAVSKIIWLTVETAVVAILTMALTFAFPTKAYCNILIDILGKIYSNNFLVILNRRIRIIDGRSTISQLATHEHSLSFNAPDARRQTASAGMMEVKIQQSVWSEPSVSKEGDLLPPLSPVRHKAAQVAIYIQG